MTVRRNGWLYVYVSNESNQDVYFDDLVINHKRGPVVEANNYYAFGLQIPGISSKALGFGGSENRYKYNGGNELQTKEFTDGSGLETYDAVHRMYDPQIGRFMQLDALPDLDYDYSPYVFAGDNPILLNDPLGLSKDTAWKNLQEVVVTAKPLDKNNGQVYPSRSGFWDFLNGQRGWVGHNQYGDHWATVTYSVDAKGYLTGNILPTQLIANIPVGFKPMNLKAIFNIKNWIRGRYAIYRGTKEGLDYFGKAKGGIELRYTIAELENMGVRTIEGLENLPNNATALGVEQLIIDLNGGAGTGQLANKIPATVKEIYINEGRYWLDNNLPNWEQLLKFK